MAYVADKCGLHGTAFEKRIFFLRTFLADIKGFVHFQIKMSL